MRDDIKPLPTIVYVSDEEFDHVLEVLDNSTGPSEANLRGAEFLRHYDEMCRTAKKRRS